MASRPRLLSQQTLNVQRATLQWARIGSVAGAASDTTYTDTAGIVWRCVQWNASNASGLVLAVPGLLDVLILGGGGNGQGSPAYNATGGFWILGIHPFAAGTHAVTIGGGGQPGGASNLGALSARGGWKAATAQNGSEFTSSITGTALGYSACNSGSPRANRGDGGDWTVGATGSTGVVIARTPV